MMAWENPMTRSYREEFPMARAALIVSLILTLSTLSIVQNIWVPSSVARQLAKSPGEEDSPKQYQFLVVFPFYHMYLF